MHANCLIGFLISILVNIWFPGLYAQDLKPIKLVFENENELSKLGSNATSSLTLSDKHYHFGKASLKWNFENKSYITAGFSVLSEAESPLAYGDYFPNSPTTSISIYNEQPQDGKLRFSYGTSENRDQVWFDINLKFTGWRTIWVPYYEMEGDTPERNTQINFNSFKVQAIDVVAGSVYFDDIVFSQYQDDRYAYPDFLVPFIKTDFGAEQDHWMPSLAYYQSIKNLEVTKISSEAQAELIAIENRLQERLKIKDTITEKLRSATAAYDKLDLDVGQTVKGRPVTFRNGETYFEETPKYDEDYIEVHRLGQIMLKLAEIYTIADAETKTRVSEYFIDATRYFLDQGWQAGSSGGTRHHIGYSLEDIAVAFFIMRKPLENAQLLNEVGDSMQWVFNLGKILANKNDFVANIDYFNTQSFYHLMIIYMRSNYNEIAALLEKYSQYMSITLAQDDAHGVFKKDGTSWHHGGHYPAYGMGAFKNLPKVFRTLASTRYQIGTDGHQNFKKALLTTRLYSNTYDFGFANAGRHPLEDNSIEFLEPQFRDMIFSGNPEHTSTIDTDFGSAYLRLWGSGNPKIQNELENNYNLEAEELPGYHTLPYAATAIHRRNDWAAILKGYSKYVWASEIYIASNRYGRYPANGTIQLLSEKGEEKSGFNQLGWDWNRYPGATIIYLPLEELESDLSLLMFKSNQTFAGAVQQNDNGVFAMILDESSGSNADGQRGTYSFPGKLKAHKSVFSFGDKLICIGSSINSIDENHDVETVLFQNNLNHATRSIYADVTGTVQKSPFTNSWKSTAKDGWLIDAYKNAYHILSASKVHLKQTNQKSYHNKYSINTGKMNPKGNGVQETSGDYGVAYINHGKAPKDASYQYVIYPFSAQSRLAQIENGNFKDSSYKILNATRQAHIVFDRENNTTGYVVFDEKYQVNNGLLKSVSDPTMLMIKEVDAKNISVSIVQPDLNFKTVEGIETPGEGHELRFEATIKGIWQLDTKNEQVSIDHSESNTTIRITVKDGATNTLHLSK